MRALTIPQRYRRGLQLVAELPDDTVHSLQRALETAQPSLAGSELTAHVSASVTTLPKDDLDAIIQALVSLCSARPSLSVDVPKLAEVITASEDLELSDEQRGVLRDRLEQLLSRPSLVVTAKAAGLLAEDAHVYEGSRVITDIRPVFLDGPEDGPKAAVIVHLLRITYLKDSRFHEFHVALDTEAIRKLRADLERAEQKEATLRPTLRSAGLTYLEVSDE